MCSPPSITLCPRPSTFLSKHPVGFPYPFYATCPIYNKDSFKRSGYNNHCNGLVSQIGSCSVFLCDKDSRDMIEHNCFFQVKKWITLNEPNIFATRGHGTGFHAPGIREPGTAVYKVAHMAIKAHATAYHIYQQEFKATQKGNTSCGL